MKFRVRELEETTSTNDEIKRALEAREPEGLVVRALRQTGGYGRQGRTWESPEGGLYLSVLLRPQTDVELLPTLGLVVSLAVRQACARVATRELASQIRIKWPNDVVLAGKTTAALPKLCGISFETHAGGVCIGIGINVRAASGGIKTDNKCVPAYLDALAPHLGELALPDALQAVTTVLLDQLDAYYERWLHEGFTSFTSEYNAYDVLAGHPIRVVDRDEALVALGDAVCIDDSGRLIVRDANGKEIVVASGEVHIV